MDRIGDWTVLGATTAAFFVTMVARLALSPLVPELLDAFAVSKGAVGLALSGMWAAYALFQFPGGLVADRVGERPVVLVSMVAVCLASLALAAAPTFPVFAVAAVALGATAGLYFTAGVSFLTGEFRSTGRALGVHEVGASLAGLFAPVAVGVVATRFGWRAGLLVPATVAPVAFVAFAAAAPPTPPSNPSTSLLSRVDVSALRELLGRPSIRFTTLVAMGAFFTWQAFVSFFPTFLVEYVRLSTTRASLVFAGVFAVTVLGAPLLGWASDTTGRDLALGASLLAGVVGYACFLFVGGVAAVVAGTLLLGFGLSWPAVVDSRFMDNLAADERGTGFGLVRTFLLLVSAQGSVVTGALAQRAGWLVAYGAVAGVLGLLVCLLVANRIAGIDDG
jgi:predicted MFS family arabinose efflux permease